MTTHSVTLKGGPTARNLKLQIDGEDVPQVSRVELVGDVHDVMRVVTTQIAMVADIEVEARVEIEPKYAATIEVYRANGTELEQIGIAHSEGSTLAGTVLLALGKIERELAAEGKEG